SRDKISNSLSKSAVGHDYLRMVKRSRSAHLRLLSQNTFSIESDSVDSSEPSTPQLPQPPADHGVFSSVGERIRSIFNKKPPIHSKSLITVPSARSTTPPQAIRSSSLASKPLSYQQTTSIE
uniref:Uncharacterized protein n=1 Tax=Caenorhabditis japonica TaxID=281687 RepID=A0A8R1IWF3_CAEJA